MPMILLQTLSSTLSRYPHITSALPFSSFLLFFRLVAQLRTHLAWYRSPYDCDGPPVSLPSDVQSFIAAALSVSPSLVGELWDVFKEFAWTSAPADGEQLSQDLVDILRQYGTPYNIGVYNLHPPTRFCLQQQCKYTEPHHAGEQRVLSESKPIHIVYFSREYGPVPAVSYSLSCRRCGSHYYPTYYVHTSSNGERHRSYFNGVPRALHVATHVFIEASVCQLFTNATVCAWVSFTNNARIYNLEHEDACSHFPTAWSNDPLLTTTIVSDAFFIFALLRDCHERATNLTLKNDGDQSTRLEAALHARTAALIGPGREGWNHVCERCCATKMDDNGQSYIMRAAVMDGVTVGRPCCKVLNCQGELPSQRARYCERHADMDKTCVVVGCTVLAPSGFKTCLEPSHRELEDSASHSALFQLRRRLERLRKSTIEVEGQAVEDELVDVDADGREHNPPHDKEDEGTVMVNTGLAGPSAPEDHQSLQMEIVTECPTKSDEGNVRPRARFGRRRTHNEQLVVATCGVIVGRATFFGSEGIDGSRKFLHALYPTQKSLPQVLFYDNACQFKKHVMHIKDQHFDNCAMPVDPFHAKTKHKETDLFCGQYCNAALFPDLIVGNRWRFNASAAEMTNAWFGGFHAMTREMRPARYDFFLDEMIKLRNRMIVTELQLANTNPVDIPHELLL
ncbi:hypothetical protein DAEQUDRAFT_229694 [Daedalea quercina L-15889]|uniref:CxC5 like cysteine cluster associated with KDZ domain-containing protein n=1 Tax=Daedalea quercina L-15889 TaxID=1314783 RepID=A0A165KGP7_9APHY|nr:hypothetical protein DAEQUDRAFT_229694 [Daedalea quercina L-15889]